MPILGAHESIAGGYFRAVEIAHRVGCDCVQIFTKNNNQWRAKELTDEDVARFRQALADFKITHPIAHDSYLINLASPDKELWKKSVDAFIVELLRADRLGIPYVVTHPGAFTTSSEAAGIKNVSRASTRSTNRLAASKPSACWKTPPAKAPASATASSNSPKYGAAPRTRSASAASASTPATPSPPATRSAPRKSTRPP